MCRLVFLLLVVFSLPACSTLNSSLSQKTKQVEYYRIFDIKTTEKRAAIIKATSDGLSKNIGNANEATPIPSTSTPPNVPGRFKVVNIANKFEGNMGALFALSNAGGGNLGMKTAQCDDAVWTAQATKNVRNSWNLNMTSCLFEYKDGYHLDMYAHFTKEEGGLIQISREMANALVGTPEEWVEKTFLDVVRTINQKTNSNIAFVEGYPEIQGTPWLDSDKAVVSQK